MVTLTFELLPDAIDGCSFRYWLNLGENPTPAQIESSFGILAKLRAELCSGYIETGKE